MQEEFESNINSLGLFVADHVSAMLAYWDKDLVCRFANAAYRDWFGKTRDEMVDKMTIKELLGPLYEKNLPYISGVLEGKKQTFEREIPLPSGEVRYSIANYFPDIVNGKVKGFFVHVADITSVKLLEKELIKSNEIINEQNKRLAGLSKKLAQAYQKEKDLLNRDIDAYKVDKEELEMAVKGGTKQLEEKNIELESLFQYATMGILVVNSEGEIITINPCAEKLFQYERDELIGKKVEILIPKRFTKKHEGHREKYGHDPHARQMGAQMDLFGMRKDGSEFPVEISLSPFTTSKGNFVTAFIVDITVRKRDAAIINEKTAALKKSYKTLEEKNISLEKMNKELETFTFISTHDLQEPLRKIKTFAAALLDEEQKNLSKSGKDYLERMGETVTRMRTLIDDLLTYSRAKNAERKFEKADLTQIAEEVIADFKETIKEKKAVIKADGLCEGIIIRFQFRQLLHNLISNALKFSHPKRPLHIIIKSETALGKKFDNGQLSPEINYCHISVSDNGIGFDPQYKDNIFVVFQRLHEYNEYKGTGIGLAICKRIVENHNGVITATGEVNKGARFDIYLPAQQAGIPAVENRSN